MSGASIAAEVNAALAEVARDVGDGSFEVTLLEPAAQPVNPWDAPAGAPTEHAVNAIVQDYPASMIDGTLVQQGDKRIMISATVIRPEVNWRVIDRGTSYAIMMIRELGPSGVALYYELQGRA
jgi:hypothetical protein